MNLFDLTENYVKFFTMLDEAEEITDEMKEMADNLNVEIEEKAKNYADIIKDLEDFTENCKRRKNEINSKQKSAENKIKWLKSNLQASMELTGKRKLKSGIYSFNIQKNALSLDIRDEKNIDDSYYIVERKLNKKELLQDIKEGLIVDGVGLKQTESLRIR